MRVGIYREIYWLMEQISKSMSVCIKQRVVLEIMGTKMYIRSKQIWLPFSFGWNNKVCPSETTHTVHIDLFSVSLLLLSQVPAELLGSAAPTFTQPGL